MEEGAIPGDYEYTNSAEKDFVENVLKNDKYDEYNDTSVFEGHKAYLLNECFVEDASDVYTSYWGTQARPAGWDVDRRAGGVRTDNKSLHIFDASDDERIFMTHKLMTHKSGALTLETSVSIRNSAKSGFFIELLGGGKTIMHIETQNDYFACADKAGRLSNIKRYGANEQIPVKAVFYPEKKTYDLIIGDVVKENLPYVSDTDVIDEISIGTPKKGQVYAQVYFVHVYLNYVVNERFLTTQTGKSPLDWAAPPKGVKNVGAEETQSARSDVNSYRLTTSSILEIPKLTKHYKTGETKLITEFSMIIPEKYEGIEARILSGKDKEIAIGTKGEDFVLSDGSVLYENFRKNLWYRFKVITDTEKKIADIYVNYRKYAENVPISGAKIDGVEFTSGRTKGSTFMFDDVLVYPDFPLPTGYPTEPRTVEPDKNVKEVGMLMYSMWREGYHFGWDTISPLSERTPYQGYYTEGDGETADWAIKWQKEHGVTYQIYTWSGLERTADEPIKRPIRSQAWLDGLHNAQFDMDYCLMWSTPTDKTIRGLEDFKNNILPFWVEYCWKNPRYKRIDNKFLLYTYSTDAIRNYLGGKEALHEAINLMNEAAKSIGADGVTFVAVEGGNFSNDEAKELGMYRYTYGWGGGSASDADIVIKGITDHMETGNFRDYIPSVPMGYEDSPWRTAGLGGFMTVKEIERILTTVNDNSENWKSMGNTAADMVVLTCWDEWGEGHYFCPSMTHGFGYLNAIRNTLTTKGVLTDEELPSRQSYARMNSLYPIGRQTLKLRKDMRETDMPDADSGGDLVLMQKIDFSTPEDFARCEIEKSAENLRQENGMLAFDCLGADPSVFVNNIDLPADKIAAVRITGIQPMSGTNTLFFQTTADPNMGVNAKRFQGAMNSGKMTSVMLYPANESRLKGTLTRFRIDPPDAAVGTMYVKSLEIYASAKAKLKLEVNGSEYDLAEPLALNGDTSYMSVYQFFNGHLLVPCHWYRNERRLHIEYNGKTVELYDGKKEYTVNGIQKSFSDPAYYDDGNFFVPVREFFTEMDYNVDWNGAENKVILTTERYRRTANVPADADGEWNFNKNDDMQGWAPSREAPFAKVENGALTFNIMGEAVVQKTGMSFKADDYKTLRIRVKNESAANTFRFFYTSDRVKAYGSPNRMIFEISSNDKDYKEYTVDLTSVPNWGGTISALRIDFIGATEGSVSIDSIKLEK